MTTDLQNTPRPRGRPPGQSLARRRFVQITIHLEPDLVAALDTEAAEAGCQSRSEVIRAACHQYLRRLEKRRARMDGEDNA